MGHEKAHKMKSGTVWPTGHTRAKKMKNGAGSSTGHLREKKRRNALPNVSIQFSS